MSRDITSFLGTVTRYHRPTEPESAFGCMADWWPQSAGDRLCARDP